MYEVFNTLTGKVVARANYRPDAETICDKLDAIAGRRIHDWDEVEVNPPRPTCDTRGEW